MQTWQVAAVPRGSADAALAHVIGAVGAAGFADLALAGLNEALPAASWSVYRLHPDAAPCLHLSASHGIADTTRDCFAVYGDGLYRHDRSFAPVRDAAREGRAAVLHMRADDAPNAVHREAIYRRHGMIERLSVATLDGDGSLLAVNLYRHDHQAGFADGERHAFADRLAPLPLAIVHRHLALAPEAAMAPRERLAQACPALTPRELDVCERLLRGWTHDGIASDLGLGLASVKTYRARAFERLGIHFRSELFARFGSASACPTLG